VCSVHGRSTSMENISQFKTGNEVNDDGDNYSNDNNNKNKATAKNTNNYNGDDIEDRNDPDEPKYWTNLKARCPFLDANQEKVGCTGVNDTSLCDLARARYNGEPATTATDCVFRSNFSSEGFQRIILSRIINWENISPGLWDWNVLFLWQSWANSTFRRSIKEHLPPAPRHPTKPFMEKLSAFSETPTPCYLY